MQGAGLAKQRSRVRGPGVQGVQGFRALDFET